MYESGLRLNLSKVVRDRENILSYFKTFNYGINYLEDLRAKNKNYEGALFLNNQGNICETSYANIFLKSENTIYTPHIRNGILNGVMRRLVIAKALEMGYEVRKTNITIRELNNFEECFITNSIAGVIPVKSINNYMFASRKFASLINKEEILKRSWN
jgi:branched-subunit amino acid aminotransferase/4-amino-4-deoxychorismate lyase